jgi:nicotinamide-nucleotide amidase
MLKILRDASELAQLKHNKSIKVIGFTLPCKLQDDAEELDDMGAWACELYAHDWATLNLGEAHAQLLEALDPANIQMKKSGDTLEALSERINPEYPDREYRVDRGNVAARLRMIFSYGIAKRLGGAQFTTDNLSEGLCGFWTLCGDEGTFKYIQNILKGLEQPMLMHAARIPSPFIVQKETDGLGIAEGDVAQLYGELYTGNENYVNVDVVLINMLLGKQLPDPLNPSVSLEKHPVVKWHRRTEFKRNPFSLKREQIGLSRGADWERMF